MVYLHCEQIVATQAGKRAADGQLIIVSAEWIGAASRVCDLLLQGMWVKPLQFGLYTYIYPKS